MAGCSCFKLTDRTSLPLQRDMRVRRPRCCFSNWIDAGSSRFHNYVMLVRDNPIAHRFGQRYSGKRVRINQTRFVFPPISRAFIRLPSILLPTNGHTRSISRESEVVYIFFFVMFRFVFLFFSLKNHRIFPKCIGLFVLHVILHVEI